MKFTHALLLVLLSCANARAEQTGTAIFQMEVLDDSSRGVLYDPSLYLAIRQVHAQLWAGDFTEGFEIGGYLKDRRRSAYSVAFRRRENFDSIVHLETEQIIENGYVAVASIRFIHALPAEVEDRDNVQLGAGFDKYHGDYDFFSLRLFRDPREDHHVTAVISHRFSPTATRWVTVGLVPRTDDAVGAFVQARWDFFRAGIGRYNRFDFTDIDRTIWNFGLQFDF